MVGTGRIFCMWSGLVEFSMTAKMKMLQKSSTFSDGFYEFFYCTEHMGPIDNILQLGLNFKMRYYTSHYL